MSWDDYPSHHAVRAETDCGIHSFFERLHPINGILDPVLHTPEFVRPRSALLFTWILAITAQFDPLAASLSKRLRLHGEKLSKQVHASGFKSVEISQGYYLSLLCTVPSSTLSEDHSWPYTTYAIGMISDLALNPEQANHQTSSGPSQGEFLGSSAAEHEARLVRNRERTWFRLMLWERAHSAARGRVTPFPENDLTEQVESWWQHPLSDPTDRYTSAFVLLRRRLAHLRDEVKVRVGKPNNRRHWVRDLVDSQLELWRAAWVPPAAAPNAALPVADQMRNVFLRYVYMHGRLWTLSFALHDGSNTANDAEATTEDCFEATVNCCETTVRDLREIGEPMYCMMTPTWAMSSYAAVLALRLFPVLYGARSGQEVELLALLSELALQLERAGTTPSHRFGTAALLGQHLLHILRRKLRPLVGATTARPQTADAAGPPFTGLDTSQPPVSYDELGHAEIDFDAINPLPFVGLSPGGEDAAQQVFSGMMREWCGPWFESPL